MPIYEYNCDKCDYKFDRLVSTSNSKVNCPLCQGDVDKLMSSFAVGASQSFAGGHPAAPAPNMCTSCGPSPLDCGKN